MDIQMIQFTGLLSIMLIFFGLLIMVFFILMIESESKAKNGGKSFEKKDK